MHRQEQRPESTYKKDTHNFLIEVAKDLRQFNTVADTIVGENDTEMSTTINAPLLKRKIFTNSKLPHSRDKTNCVS